MGIFYDQHHKRLPEIFLYGQTITRTAITLTGKFKTLGVSIYPNTLKPIFGFDADELTDDCLDLNLLFQNQSISEQMLNGPSIADRIQILSSCLWNQIRKNDRQVDEITKYALSQIMQSNGSIALKEVQRQLRLSERSLERRFKQYVGIPPKLFARVCRFQASLNQLRTNNYTKLSDIAYENGYADQAHFIRVFKEFAGFSPFQFQKQSVEIVENFPVLIK